jgi:YhcH/YjgK/YiaL family protein
MIVDTVENISRYAALGGNLAKGLEFLRESFNQVIPDGRQAVLGDAVYATASAYVTEPKTAKLFEAHDKYIDIQYLFQGEEALYWAPRASLTVTTPYSEAKDVAKLSGEGTEITLVPGVFVVLFPWDGHMPGCALHAPAQVRKMVIKALYP